jgi:hypothetical protein
MPTTTVVLYTIWGLLPLGFLGMALWSFLERMGGKAQVNDDASLFRQFLFVLGCVLLAVAIDQYALEWIVSDLLSKILPLGVFQVALLPLILFLGAIIIGPSEEIRIGRAPRPSAKPGQTGPRRGGKS